MDELPISEAALFILLRLGRVIERKLYVVEGAQFVIFQNSNTATIGSYGESDRSRSQVIQYFLEVRMHPVLARAQIHGADRQPFHNRPNLIQRETVGARGIAIAESALEVALIGEPEPERDPDVRTPRTGIGGCRNLCGIAH